MRFSARRRRAESSIAGGPRSGARVAPRLHSAGPPEPPQELDMTRISKLAVAVLGAALATGAFAQAAGKLELFSWWAGDEGPALEALIKLYKQKYPGVEVTNATVTGGSGVNARAVLKTRMLGGDPPDSFQVHAGQELVGTWVVAERMEPLTELFESEGWMDKFPADLIDLLSYNGEIWSVPVNIHRSN